jgi:hypothetical protein
MQAFARFSVGIASTAVLSPFDYLNNADSEVIRIDGYLDIYCWDFVLKQFFRLCKSCLFGDIFSRLFVENNQLNCDQ